MASRRTCLRCGTLYDKKSFFNHLPCHRESGLQLPTCHHLCSSPSRFLPGEVVIDRSRSLAVSPDSTLPNLVAVSESSSALMPSSNIDATHINLEQLLSDGSTIIPSVNACVQDDLIPQYHQTGLRLPVCQDTWPPGSRLAGIFGLPPGEVAIDRSRPLVALPDSTLPNLVAVSESSSALMPSSNDDATVINLEQQPSNSGIIAGVNACAQDDWIPQDHQAVADQRGSSNKISKSGHVMQ